MGNHRSKKAESYDSRSEVNLDHFSILRSIGKGSFGKVCIVMKKDTEKLYAMKYMNKTLCIEKDSIRNVFREQELLKTLEHPFIVNLWFTFQDSEDIFMVVDLLLGGDLRYHIQHNTQFDDNTIRLYLAELSLALEYLHSHHVLHRDIKPDNILLDEMGHVHITDFNIATVIQQDQLATSLSGTKPYMAPEMFRCVLDDCLGYSFSVDWWALGCTIYEVARGKRLYDVHSDMSSDKVLQIYYSTTPHMSSHINTYLKDLLLKLLALEPGDRCSSMEEIAQHTFMKGMNMQKVLGKQVKSNFIPSTSQLNCDPTYELEELIIESKPLHKKKKRLAKQNSQQRNVRSVSSASQDSDPLQQCLETIDQEFQPFNRERTKDILIGDDESKVDLNNLSNNL